MRLYDAHNHLQDERLEAQANELVRAARETGVVRMVVNGSTESDWTDVTALAERHPDIVIPSYGLHPWYIHERTAQWEARLREALSARPSAVGEIGLDRWKADLPWEGQEDVFCTQLRIAAEHNVPASIHCLQAWGRLVERLESTPLPACGFILHSYGGSAELVDRLAPLGAYFSFPGAFAREKKERQREAFRRVPPDRLLIETDAPDQLPPRGQLDPAAYALIGGVYAQWEQAEPFYQDAVLTTPKVGVYLGSYPGLDAGKSEEGAVLLCEQAKYDCNVLDGLDSIEGYELLILTDSTIVDEALAAKLERFYRGGGKLLLSGNAGHSADGWWMLGFLPLEFKGEVAKYPTFWRARPAFDADMSSSDRVFYQQGYQVVAGAGVEVWIDRVLPYFKRTAVTFSSHFQTPPVAEVDSFPAVLAGERFVYFADPIFREYRQSGNIVVREVWEKAVDRLIGAPAVGRGLPSAVNVYPLRKGNDLLVTLLHYVPVRKAMDIDVIDERGSFAGEILTVDRGGKHIIDFATGEKLVAVDANRYELPARKGVLRLTIQDYFL
ncbi:MAG: TatD family hydrolase [Verrucomicrobia bacterium]|nr:TatD family hydrolase [Verrucomicrobiota bacterium]